MGGPTQDDFPGHVYPGISQKCFSSLPLTVESRAEQKGRWHAQCKASKAKNNKQYRSCMDLVCNVVAI